MAENPYAKYFDYNATTPLSAAARKAWLEASDQHWHNPSSLYREAGMARLKLEDCREELADFLGCDEPERIVFTGGATEANNAVIRYFSRKEKKLAFSAVEHPCVMETAEKVCGKNSRIIPVNSLTGAVDLESLAEFLDSENPGAVSVMAANNETGAIQAWKEIAEMCAERGIDYHCDAAQWIGKMPANALETCGFVTGSAHKFGGPKGVGFLMLPEGLDSGEFEIFVGGPQENGFRAGTEDLAGVMAMMAALSGLDENFDSGQKGRDRDAFEREVEEKVGCELLLRDSPRLWNTSMFVLPHSKNLKWLTRLSQRGFSVSTGSACSAGKGNPSRVMQAMELDFDRMGRVLRVSGGRDTSEDDWMALADAIREVGAEL